MSSRQVAVITGDINASSGMPTNHAAKSLQYFNPKKLSDLDNTKSLQHER